MVRIPWRDRLLHRPYRFGLPARLLMAVLVAGCAACGSGSGSGPPDRPPEAGQGGPPRPTIVVTYPVLASVVSALVGNQAQVKVLMDSGVDPHDGSPSAKDIEAVDRAEVVVANGLGLEAALDDGLEEAKANGRPVFFATDHITVRRLGDSGEHDDRGENSAGDPHFWVDPVAMTEVVQALGPFLEAQLGLDLASEQARLEEDLVSLDISIRTKVASLPPARRQLVTGHESLGYFADRYGLTLVGAVVPSSSSQAEASAAQLAELKHKVQQVGAKVVFTEVGTPHDVAEAVARETGAVLVELPSHNLTGNGSYERFVTELADTIVQALAA